MKPTITVTQRDWNYLSEGSEWTIEAKSYDDGEAKRVKVTFPVMGMNLHIEFTAEEAIKFCRQIQKATREILESEHEKRDLDKKNWE